MSASDTAFLGTGWSFPPSFSRLNLSVDMVSADTDIRQSLWILFSTWIGERLMLAQYGTDLWRRIFGSVTTTFKTEVAAGVRQAILNWEPRINVDDVMVEADAETAGLFFVTVAYTIRMTNARSNLVYPFYLQEANLAPAAP
jgi:phage baseplate assembly protein W